MQDKRIEIMSNAHPVKALIVMAVPVIMAMLVQVLYNLVDTFFIGQLGDPVQLAAANLANPAFVLIMSIATIVGVGGASYVSRCLGMGNKESASKTIAICAVLAAILGAIVAVFGGLFAPGLMHLLGAKGEVYEYTYSYVIVLLMGSFITILNFSISQLVRAEGSAKLSMYGMMVGTVANIILDPIFIFVLGQGIRGAAVATILGNLLALLFYVYCYARKKTLLELNLKLFSWDWSIIKQVVSIGVPAALGQLLVSGALMVSNNIATTYGVIFVAAIGVCNKFMMCSSFIFQGFSSGSQPLIGFNYGAQNYKRVRDLVKVGFVLSSGVGLFIAVMFALFAPFLIGIFTPSTEIIEAGTPLLRLLLISLPFMGPSMVCGAAVQAMGKSLPSLFLAVSRQVVFYVPLILLFNKLFGMNGFVLAHPITDVAMSALALVVLMVILKKESFEQKVSTQANQQA